jgi:hypothetical protein
MSATAEEVWSLFKETDRLIRELREQSKETDRQFQETDRRFQETDRRFQETDRRFQDWREQSKETDRKIRELGQQIGGLGDKFGYFTEGMALPSMERMLMERFGMTTVMPRVHARQGGETLEIDVLACANGDVNRAVVVEVKSRVKREAIEQLQRLVACFRVFFPEHGSKAIMGLLAGVDWDAGVAQEARESGFLTASIHDQMFELTTPADFEPKLW